MAIQPLNKGPFHSSKEELAQKKISAYELAFLDQDFMLREELRPVRLQLELLKPELILKDMGIENTIVFFGSARIPNTVQATQNLELAIANANANPESKQKRKEVEFAENVLENSRYLQEAQKLAYLISKTPKPRFYVITGGGPSFMEAANQGAHEAGVSSIGLGVMLPHEQVPNPYITPELSFQFHYFAIRKMHFLMRARALIAFPGGFGTLDELFETLTLMQTQKIDQIPLLLFRRAFWEKIINFEALVEQGVISSHDLNLIRFVETAEEAWEIILDFYTI